MGLALGTLAKRWLGIFPHSPGELQGWESERLGVGRHPSYRERARVRMAVKRSWKREGRQAQEAALQTPDEV